MPPPAAAIRTVTPTQCHLMDLSGLAAKDIIGPLETVKEYEDESHLIRRLYRCPRCGQLYFYEFYEEIDWKEGNDPQYRTLVPVADEASADALNGLSPLQLLAYPSIRMDYPQEAGAPEKPRWANLGKNS